MLLKAAKMTINIGPKTANWFQKPVCSVAGGPTWMERRCLAERQVCISEPNLHHKPSDSLDGPCPGSERPKREEQPGETDSCNAHEKYEFSCHRTESTANIGIIEMRNMQGRT